MSSPGAREDPIDVDVLIVGGGVQGLTLLRALTDRGYAAAIVTNAPLGSGQTLHSHGFLNSGYELPDPELRRSVEEDWLPFLAEQDVETYGDDRFFGIVPRELYEALEELWTGCGYPFEAVSPDALPRGFRKGLPEDAPLQVLRVEEYCVPKRGLVRALGDGVTDRILIGDVTGVRFEPAAADDAVSVASVTVASHEAGNEITVSPAFVATAAGTGTSSLVESMVADRSFADAAGGRAGRIRGAIGDQLDRVTHERVHMLCIRGPATVLPGASVLFADRGLSLVSADVDPTHDRVGTDTRTWYVTPRAPEPDPVEAVSDSALADPDPALVARGIERLFDAYPPLRAALDEVEFGVYAGYKQNVGDSRSEQLCEPVDGVPNLLIALPSVIGGAWRNARTAAGLIEDAIESGRSEPLPGGGAGVRVGDVVERTDAFEWSSWPAFRAAYLDGDA